MRAPSAGLGSAVGSSDAIDMRHREHRSRLSSSQYETASGGRRRGDERNSEAVRSGGISRSKLVGGAGGSSISHLQPRDRHARQRDEAAQALLVLAREARDHQVALAAGLVVEHRDLLATCPVPASYGGQACVASRQDRASEERRVTDAHVERARHTPPYRPPSAPKSSSDIIMSSLES